MRPHLCHTRNRSTSKESSLNKFDSVRREGRRNTTEDIREGFAPGARKFPLKTWSQIKDLRFRGFGVGAEEVQQTLNRMSIFSVFLCDFRVFRVMAGWRRSRQP